jgi:hypothetical protein
MTEYIYKKCQKCQKKKKLKYSSVPDVGVRKLGKDIQRTRKVNITRLVTNVGLKERFLGAKPPRIWSVLMRIAMLGLQLKLHYKGISKWFTTK